MDKSIEDTEIGYEMMWFTYAGNRNWICKKCGAQVSGIIPISTHWNDKSLIIAGALIAAEIDRLNNMESKPQ